VVLVDVGEDAPRAPAEAPASIEDGEPAAGAAEDEGARIRGTVRRQLHTYHPEVVDRVRATFEVGVVPTPDQLERAWEQLGLALQVTRHEPLAGVEVTITPERASTTSQGVTSQAVLRALSDDAGSFHVDALPPGRYALRLTPPPGPPHLRHDDPMLRRSIYLGPGEIEAVAFDLPGEMAALTGRVVDSAGRPIEDATVAATSFVVPEVGIPDEWSAPTDQQGRYSLPGLQPASLQTAIGNALVDARAEVRAETLLAVDVGASGYAPARALVLPLSEERERAAVSVAERLCAWRESVDEIEWLPFALERPYAGALRPVFERGAQVLPDIVLAPAATVSGSVVSTLGKPLPLAEVRLAEVGSPAARPGLLAQASTPPGWVRSDARGAFLLTGVPAGSYGFEVRTEAAGLQRATNAPLEVIGAADLRDVRVVVRADEKGRIAGTVVVARTGEPLQDFRLEIGTTQGWTMEDGKQGVFEVARVQEGPVTLRVHAKGFASETLEGVVRGGQTTELHATLSRAGHLYGDVLLNGEPAQGMLSVYVDAGAGARAHYGWFEGRYRTPRLRSGRPYRVVAEVQLAPGSSSKLVAHAVALPVGDEDTELHLRLKRPTSTLEGSTRIDGEFLAWLVYALEGGASGLGGPEGSPLLRAVAEGRRSPEDFELALAPGAYTLLFRVLREDPHGGPPLRQDQVTSVRVAAGTGAQVQLVAP
jgi:hypothetical protein